MSGQGLGVAVATSEGFMYCLAAGGSVNCMAAAVSVLAVVRGAPVGGLSGKGGSGASLDSSGLSGNRREFLNLCR